MFSANSFGKVQVCAFSAFSVLLALGRPAYGQKATEIVFVGDVMLDGGPGHLISNGVDPFLPTKQLLSAADLTIGNLECAVAEDGHREDKPYTFLADDSALPAVREHFSAVSLANNHALDWGRPGFVKGLKLLEDAKVPYFGGGRTARDARRPLLLKARGKLVALLGYNDFPPLRFAAGPAAAGTAWLRENEVAADLETARSKYHADIVLVYLHWGTEFDEKPDDNQVRLAHRFIDAGATAVIGSHPHVTQTVEFYKDRPIVYSLGNFLFDYFPDDPPVFYGWVARLVIDEKDSVRLRLDTVVLDLAGVPYPVLNTTQWLDSAHTELIPPPKT
jgi:poly-gamma-glutamate capsule biosynthesis protein CapA/YwtB (metallophosphatase superfamily)